MGSLESITKFDNSHAEHIQIHKNKGEGHTSYFSETTCEGFIYTIGSSVLDLIIYEIKKCKYYSV